MYAMKMDVPDLDRMLQKGLYPELVKRAMVFARPILAEAETAQFRVESPEGSPTIDVRAFAKAISDATMVHVGEVVVMPDDASFPGIQIAPKQRLGELLRRMYGGTVRGLSDDVRRGLNDHLNRILKIGDEKAAMTDGFDYAVRVSRRDILFNFIGLAVLGDECRLRRLAGLVQWLRRVTPLAVVDLARGMWLAHRV